MKKYAMALTFLAALPLALAAQVTKEDLKKLAAAGISDDVIVSYIKANGGVARLSADDVIELKQAGATEKVLSVALGTTPASSAPAAESRNYTAERTYDTPSTTYVYNTTPASYYTTPAVSYSIGFGYPYYYPYYYSSCYPRYYGYGHTGYYGGGYCSPHYGYGYGGGHYNTYATSRGYAGVSGYRGGGHR